MTGKNTSVKPTGKELEILQVIWEKESCSVKEIHKAMGGDQQNGYTTILKLLQIMFEKGIVSRKKSGKLHLYEASVTKENTKQQLVGKLIETVFEGSASELVMSALGNTKSSKEEIKAIRAYLDKIEGGEK
ncbi:MAG: BlaI/MecI/CopY family transcriptional regulator [Cyclobacteriaceae bacterium]